MPHKSIRGVEHWQETRGRISKSKGLNSRYRNWRLHQNQADLGTSHSRGDLVVMCLCSRYLLLWCGDNRVFLAPLFAGRELSSLHGVQVQLDWSSVWFMRQIGPARTQPILTHPSAAKRHSSGRQHISEPSAGRHCEAEASLSYIVSSSTAWPA